MADKLKKWKHKDKVTRVVTEIELTEKDYLFLEVLSDLKDAIRSLKNG